MPRLPMVDSFVDTFRNPERRWFRWPYLVRIRCIGGAGVAFDRVGIVRGGVRMATGRGISR